MSSSGSGTRSVVENRQNPPQIATEGKKGYIAAQDFFKGKLANPDIYGGQRLADIDPAQLESINQQKTLFSDPSLDYANQSNIGNTLVGNYLNGPQAAEAANSLTRPLFANFNRNVMPGLRDNSQFAGQGISSSRRGVAENNATEKLGADIANYAYAPVYDSERAKMMQASALVPSVYSGEGIRTSALSGAGAQSRDLQQQYLDVLREMFEEPIYRQSEAASALLGGGVWGPGSSMGTSRTRNTLSTNQEIMQYIQMAQGVASIAGSFAAASERAIKDDVVPLIGEHAEHVAETLFNLPTYTWKYQWEDTGAMHVGPMLEDTPDWMREPGAPNKLISLVSYCGALLVAVQQLNKRLVKVEKELEVLKIAK